jgi:predicted Fe-Mo cluster-binding NifX family protein
MTMVVCVPVTTDGLIDPRWGRANRLAITEIADGAIRSWEEQDVGWNALHDEGTEGSHHARVARFLREHHIEAVVANHMGPPMAHMVGLMGVKVWLGATGDARQAVVRAIESKSG